MSIIATNNPFSCEPSGVIIYKLTATYALMLAIGTPLNLTIIKVLNDENKGMTNTIYHIYPDGTRMWIAATEDI